MKNINQVLTAKSVLWQRPPAGLPRKLIKAQVFTRRALPALAALGITMVMASSAEADVEGKDTSKGGEAPGADLRQGLYLLGFSPVPLLCQCHLTWFLCAEGSPSSCKRRVRQQSRRRRPDHPWGQRGNTLWS